MNVFASLGNPSCANYLYFGQMAFSSSRRVGWKVRLWVQELAHVYLTNEKKKKEKRMQLNSFWGTFL
jgi:demethoxyubiquinone hydroxylase (CLK1/Coq7/Cat5 family)